MIGKLNNNLFIIEYISIYKNNNERYSHIYTIISNLKYYLERLQTQLIKNSAPITNEGYKEIGTIVKYGEIPIPPIPPIPIDDDYQLDYHTDMPYIKAHFSKCPNIGLENIGATCYMNATLQCFCHIEKFLNYFKYHPYIISLVKRSKDNLTSSFKLLIEKLWPNFEVNYKYYAPVEFKNKISKMNPLFEGVAANDSKDLVNFIIMTLHEELNKAKNNNIENNNILIDQRNQQQIFNNFMKEFTAKNQSIISDLFYAVNCSITECLNCHNKLYNYQIYFFIVFPLEEVRKYKIQCNNQFNMMNNMINNEVDIYECFEYDRKVNIMSGSNSMYCNNCNLNCNGSMLTYLVTGPEILILLLNRGKGIEFNIKLNFVEFLDLRNYIEYKNTGTNYKLIGVITHIGESSMSGHFIAYCSDPITGKWYKYNDAIVNEVNNFQNDVINFAMPYLLFYQKMN